MAVKTYTQSQLNNNMPGDLANIYYYITHGGNGAKPLEYNNGSGNYTSKSGNTLTYHITGKPNTLADQGTTTSSSSGGGNGGANAGAVSEASDMGDGGYGGYGYVETSSSNSNSGYDYAAMIERMLAEQRAAAEAAYEKSRGRLEEAYKDTYGKLEDNLNSTLKSLKDNYSYGEGLQKNDADKSLKEAYINYMMNKRNLNQNLAASGISGGATESSLAKLFNNYGNARNNINTTLADNLAQLRNTYNNNVSSARQAYNSQAAEAYQNYNAYLNQLEQALAGNTMSNYSGSSLSSLANYAKTLADLTGNMDSAMRVFTPTENTMGVDAVNAIQGNNMGTVTDYAKYLAMMEMLGQAV